ncbi:MAG: ubiquinone/menaquinone biosynthesis methyltransferase [Phycisphaerales bacterium]|nr:ubiquinone/menaquinone biosynthesis methyltransferase [Phycisphaerales bacterium]
MDPQLPQPEPVQTDAPAVWDRAALRDPHRQADKPARVEAMFDAIAPTYERVNRVATFGRDAAWRRRAVAAARVQPGDVVLDLCCGTGDMIRAFAAGAIRPARIMGVDFSAGMLSQAKVGQLGLPVELIRADALQLPLDSASVDVISCAFGVRNFGHLGAGLLEMYRVSRPGARIVILEFTTPANAVLRWFVNTYCTLVLPRIGTWLSGDRTGAYRYLPRSIETFETTRSMCRRMDDAGFKQVAVETLNFGGVALYRAER